MNTISDSCRGERDGLILELNLDKDYRKANMLIKYPLGYIEYLISKKVKNISSESSPSPDDSSVYLRQNIDQLRNLNKKAKNDYEMRILTLTLSVQARETHKIAETCIKEIKESRIWG